MSSIPKPIRKEEAKEIIEFHNRKKPKQTDTENDVKKRINKRKQITNKLDEEELDENEKDKQNETMSLKQAKFDVFKFGIKGFSKEEQENAKIQFAIKLGAQPAKNKCINYKELLNAKREEKMKREELLKENRSFEAKILSSKSNKSNKKQSLSSMRKSKINKGHVGNIKGHVGSFSNGVLKINKHMLKKISS